jgi:hypothetical protein
MKSLRTSVLLCLGLVLVISLFASVTSPKPVQAIDFGTVFDVAKCSGFDPLSLVPSVGGIAGGIIGTEVPVGDKGVRSNSEALKKKEECFDMLAYQVSKQLLGDITNSAKTWISSKFDGGNAGFVQNMQQQAQNEIETEFFRYIQDSKTIQNLCGSKTERDQVVGQLALDFINTYYDQQGIDPGPGAADLVDSVKNALPDSSSCDDSDSLTKTTGNIDDYLRLKQESTQQINQGLGRLADQLGWAGGFIADTRCSSPYKNPKPDAAGRCYDDSGKITTPIIVTPPGTVSNIVNNVVNSDVRRAELADELSEVLNSIGNLFVTKLFGGENSGLADTDLPDISINPPDFAPVSGSDSSTLTLAECEQQSLYVADSIALTLADIPDLSAVGFDEFSAAVNTALTQIESKLQGVGMLPTDARTQANEWLENETSSAPDPNRDLDIKPVIEAELGCATLGTTGSTSPLGSGAPSDISLAVTDISNTLTSYAALVASTDLSDDASVRELTTHNTAAIEEIKQELISLGLTESKALVGATQLTTRVSTSTLVPSTANIKIEINRLLVNN